MQEKKEYKGRFNGTFTNDWVAFKLLDVKEKKEKSKLILPAGSHKSELGPDRYEEYPFRGRVVATGPGYYTAEGIFKPVPCKVGDIIYLMPKPAEKMMWVIIEGFTYFMVRSGEIIYVT